jgi:hypothetical protein
MVDTNSIAVSYWAFLFELYPDVPATFNIRNSN